MYIEKIDSWDWPDTVSLFDGIEQKRQPEVTRKNLDYLANKLNEVIDAINKSASIETTMLEALKNVKE